MNVKFLKLTTAGTVNDFILKYDMKLCLCFYRNHYKKFRNEYGQFLNLNPAPKYDFSF